MKKNLLHLLAVAACLLPFAAGAQTRIGDYSLTSSLGSMSSIASTGSSLPTLNTDDASASVALPFTFYFGEDSCTSVMVSSNGQIGIGSANPTASNYQNHLNDMSIIVPLGLDLDLSTSRAGVYYETQGSGTNQSVVIEYNHVSPYGDSTTFFTFQVILYEGGNIDFVYDSCIPSGSLTAYVFLREHAHNSALSLAGNWSSIASSRTIAPVTFAYTNHPAVGLTLSFERTTSSCPRPQNFICSSFARADSVAFAWDADASVTQWELRWGPAGTEADSMPNIVTGITDTFYACTTMVSGTTYEAYLRSDCGTEQGFWEGPVLVMPGAYNMATTGTASIHACGGIIYDDGGATGNYSNNCHAYLTIYPSHTDSIVQVSGTLSSESCCDYLYIYDGASTTGTVLRQVRGAAQTIPVTRSTTGPLTLLFHSDGSVQSSGFALNVSCVRVPLCRTIGSLSVSHVASASAYLEWSYIGTNAMPSGTLVTLVNHSDSTAAPIVMQVSDEAYLLSGLNPGTNYTAYISTLCQGDTILGDSVSFFTRCSGSRTTSLSGTGSMQMSGVPVSSGWGNTLCQSIYTAAELTAMGLTAGSIGGMTFNWTNNTMAKEFTIYIGNTTVSEFTSTGAASWVPFSGQTQVYGPATHAIGTSGTTEYYFTAPFVWDGTSNIVVSTFMNQPSGASQYTSGFNAYSSSTSPNYRVLYKYQDGTQLTTAAASNSASSRATARPTVTFFSCDSSATCVAPNVILARNEVDTVSIIWAAGLDETSWDISYRAAADTDWTTAATGVSATSYDFTTLSPMTEYLIRVAPDCGGDSIYTVLSFTTPCVPIDTLPFTEDFENFTAPSSTGSSITNCWTRGTNYTYSSYPYITSSGHSGSHSMLFYCSGSYYSYLALPAMSAAIDSLQVSFAMRYSSACSIKVGVMTDPADISTFTEVETVTLQSANTWEMFEVPFSSYTGRGSYIALATYGFTSYAAPNVDDIEVNYIPSCTRPRNVHASSTTQNTASIHWTDSLHHDFEIEYGPSGFAHGTGSVTSSSVDSVNLYSLRHSTRYDVYVRAICSAGDTSYWSFVSSFTTACGVIDTLPWHDDFSTWGIGSGARPACWACGGYSTYPYIVNVTAADGSILRQSLNLYSSGSNHVYASLPELDSINFPIQNVQVVFNAWTNYMGSTYYSHDLVVGVCSVQGDFSTFTAIDTLTLTDSPLTYEVSFESATGAGKYVTFFSYNTGSSSAYSNYVYLDSVALELIPACQAPNHPVASTVQTYSAALNWNNRGTGTEWQVEYGPRGFVRGTGTRVSAYTRPHTITGLTPSSDYDFYVRTVCNSGDTSDWSRTAGQFSTLQNPATAPYTWNCEDAAEWANWQTSSNKRTITWHRGTAAGNGTATANNDTCAIYISTDTGATFGTNADDSVVNAACYRDIDFGTSGGSWQFTFRAKVGGTTNQGYDGLISLMVDPSLPVDASDNALTSPWGDVRYVSTLTFTHYVPNWNTYTAVLDNLTGVHRIAFFWFNQATNDDDYPFRGGAAAVDDISILPISCPRPCNIEASNVTMSTADLDWTGDDDGTYYVSYRSVTDATAPATDTVFTNHLHLTGLNPASRYQVTIIRRCDTATVSTQSLAYSFTTLVCNSAVLDTIGDITSTTTSYFLPTNNYYRYTYTQQLVTAEELGGSGEISSISFRYGYTATTQKTNCTIYMGHTTLSSFASTSDFVSVDNLQTVYTGSITPSGAGWFEISFNNPFTYNGTDNLVIAVDDNTGAYASQSAVYYVSPASATMSLCYYSDTENPDASADTLLQAFGGSRSGYAYRNQMAIAICPPNTCATPTLVTPRIRPDEVSLRWRNTSDLYALAYRRASSSSWIVDNLQTQDTFYTIHSIAPNTDYVYRVRQYCDSTGISNWQYGSFNSGDIPCLAPDSIWVVDLQHNKVKLKWTTNDSYSGFTLRIYNSYYDHEYTCAGRSKTVTGLHAGVTYYAQVKATCQGMEESSEYGDPIAFTTTTCPDATDLVALDVQGNTATVDWTPGGAEGKWEIQVGYPGFSEGNELLSYIAEEHPYTLTNLTGSMDYDVYVRGVCGDDFVSEHWSNRLRITTQYSSVTSVTDDCRVRLYPNPADADVQLTLPAGHSGVLVEVIDLTGRVQQSYTVAAGTSEQMLRSSQLAQGAYFVRISGEEVNTVKKLIVK